MKEQKKLKPIWQRIGDGLNRGNNRIKLFFLFLSLFLWLLIKLSKGAYIADLSFPLSYTDLAKSRVFTESPPKSIRLQLEGTGFSLLKYRWFSYQAIEIDLAQLKRNRTGEYFWLSSTGKASLESQVNREGTRLIRVKPDTLFFRISDLVKKNLPVELRIQPQYDTTKYSIYGKPIIEPSEVTVWGPSESLKDLDRIPSSKYVLSKAEDSLDFEVDINLPEIEHLRLSKQKVAVKLQMAPLTEGRLKIPILALNLPDSLNMELFPGEIEIQFSCALPDFKNIREDEFFVYADYLDIVNKPNAQFIALRYEQPPAEVRQMNLLTKRVEFILSKK